MKPGTFISELKMSKAPAISSIPSRGNPVSLAAADIAAAAFASFTILSRSFGADERGP